MTKLVIEDNVPLPPPPEPETIPETLAAMVPGQSVLIPEGRMTARSVGTTLSRVRSKFPERVYVSAPEEGGIRVWRKEDGSE